MSLASAVPRSVSAVLINTNPEDNGETPILGQHLDNSDKTNQLTAA